jgi:hypothetical protein
MSVIARKICNRYAPHQRIEVSESGSEVIAHFTLYSNGGPFVVSGNVSTSHHSVRFIRDLLDKIRVEFGFEVEPLDEIDMLKANNQLK